MQTLLVHLPLENKKKKETIFGALKAADEKFKIATAELTKVVADCYAPDAAVCQEDLNCMIREFAGSMDYMYSRINELYTRIYKTEDLIYEKFYEHNIGHLPKITSVEQLTKAIKVLGLSDEYEVIKKVIYASDSGKPEKEIWEISAK